MRRFHLIAILLLGGLLPAFAQEDLGARVLAAGTAKEFPGAAILTIHDRTAVKVMDSGLSYVEHDVLTKALTAEGARRLQSQTFGYDPQSAWVELRLAQVIDRQGRVRAIPLDSVVDYPAPARAIYWGAREKMVSFGRLQEGDAVRVVTFQKGFTYALLAPGDEDDKYIPPMKGHFYDIVPFYADHPVLVKSYQVSLPPGKTLQSEFYHGEARHWVHREGERTVHGWEKTGISPLVPEPGMVDLSDVAPKLLLSTSPDWQAKSRWFYKVNEDYGSFAADDDIRAKVAEITAGCRSDLDKISRLTHWVAEEIRYSGISIGEGEGFTLHRGTMTFVDRCGVCKDKAGMLITMLRAAGFESYPAMTMAGSRIDRIPADQFNHCVTIVKVGGKYTLLDPTWVPGVRELWSSAEQQQEYLMGLPEGADLLSTPLSPAADHFFRYRVQGRLDARGNWRGEITLDAEGQLDSTLRRVFTRKPKEAWNDSLADLWRRIHPAVEIERSTMSDPGDLDRPMHLAATLTIPGWARLGDKHCYLTPVTARLPLLEGVGIPALSTSPATRKYPFRTRSSQSLDIEETLLLPAGLTLAAPLPLKEVTGSGADFRGRVEVIGNRLRVSAKLACKKRIYPATDWENVRSGLLEIRKIADAVLVFDRGAK